MNKRTLAGLAGIIVGSPILTPILAGINTPLMLAAKNAFMFTNAEILQSLGLFACVFAGLSLALAGIIQGTAIATGVLPGRRKLLLDMILGGFSIFLFAYLSHDINKTIVTNVAVLWAAYAVAGALILCPSPHSLDKNRGDLSKAFAPLQAPFCGRVFS